MIKNIHIYFLMLVFAACGGGGGAGDGATGLGVETQEYRDSLGCYVEINQGSTDINSVLTSECVNFFGVAARADGKTWSLSSDNNCAFISIDGSKVVSGSPNDDQVGTCEMVFDKTPGTEQVSAEITIKNVTPTLSVSDVSITEDDPMAVIINDAQVQSNEEAFGVYSLDNASTTGAKCSDNGTLSIDSTTGAVSYQPTVNYSGVCNVRIVFDDENDENNTVYDEVAVTVVSTNDTPSITGDCSSATVAQNSAYACSDLGISDSDGEDTHTWSLASSNDCAWADVNSSTGVVSGTPNDDQVGTCTLGIKVNDGQVDSGDYTKSITITNVTPIISPITTIQSITEDDPATVVILGGDVISDEEGYGVYSLDNTNVTGTKCSDNGTVSIDSSTGAVTYTPAADFDATCNVRVVFDDQNPSGNTDFEEATISVTGVNDAPNISTSCSTSINELAAYSCTGGATDPEGDTFTWSFGTGHDCAWMSINSSTGNVTGTPARSDVGTCTLVVRADDSMDFNEESFSITVNNVQPAFTISNTTLNEDVGATVVANDAAVESQDEGFGTYSIISATGTDCQDHGTVSINATTGEVTFAPDTNYDQNCNINVQFDDGQASDNLGTDQFTVTMNPSPDNATVSLPAGCDSDINEDVTYTCTPTLNDPDTGDTHTWTIDSNTCAFISSIAASTGVMTGTPNDDHVGACSFTIKATGDQDGLVSSTLTASFNVNNVRPVISGNATEEIYMHHSTADAAYASVIQNTASDFDLGSTDETHGVYALATPSSGTHCSTVADTLSVNATTGVVSFLPNDKYVGSCTIAVDFDDQNTVNNTAATFEFTVDVVDEVPPVISYIDSPTADGTYYLGQTVDITVKFDEALTLNTTGGTPRLFLETGAIDRQVNFTGQGTGGLEDELYFQYTVQKDDMTPDLSIHSTVSYLDLAGATVEDNYGNSTVNYAVPKPADATGNSLQERKALNIDGSIAEAEPTGLPDLVSPLVELDITVGGSGVTEYQYKVVDAQTGTACSDGTGYSANVNAATNITDSIVSYPLGSQIRLCVVGVTSSGVVAPYEDAFEYVWVKDAKSVQKMDFSNVAGLPNWQDSEVDPDNPNIIYARNLVGVVFKSEDYGATWDKQCKAPQIYATSMEVSPGPDRTPYIFQENTIYKIVDNDGGPCEDLLNGTGLEVYTRYKYKNVRFAINGDMYLLNRNSAGNMEIHRSFDQGANWSLYTTVTPNVHQNDVLSFSINPYNVNEFIIGSYRDTALSNNRVYITTDGGVTYSNRAPFHNLVFQRFDWHPTIPGMVYLTQLPISQKSSDSGATWENGGEDDTPDVEDENRLVRWDIDKVTGHAYRIWESGSDTLLQKATDITSAGTVTWSTIKTFTGLTGSVDNGRSVSVSGNSTTPGQPTIAVNIENRFWISTDGGSTFTQKYAIEELELRTIAGAGDNAIYGATLDWAVVKTVDNGETWTYQAYDYNHCLGKPPRLAVNQLDTDNILMWTENYGDIDCDNFNYSIDGFDSYVERNDFSMVAPKLAVSMSVHNPKQYYLSGQPENATFKIHKTDNSAFESTVSYVFSNFNDPMPDSYIHPHNDEIIWIADNISSGALYEFGNSERIDITSRTGLSSIAAIDVYTGDKGQYYLRAMDRTGLMKVSADNGATFVTEGTTTAPLTSCNKRFLYHHPNDRNLVVTACLGENTFALSKDKGNTWDETDLVSDYSLNCNITGLAISSSKVFLGCSAGQTMALNYSFVGLKNDIADSILTVAEAGNANDLVEHFFSGQYSTIEYKVIPAGDTCDGTVTGFSTTVPKSNDPAFVSRGEYKVCVQQTDAAGTTYSVSSTIFYDATTPTFASIDLVNDVADGELTYTERFYNNYLVGNLNSSNHDYVMYAVVESTETCDVSQDYKYEIPRSNNPMFKSATNYKVCVELRTRGGLTAYGSSANISYVPTQVFANLSGLPEAYVSTDTSLNVTVSGTGVTQYKYKVDNTNSCESESGYSAAIPVGTNITDSLSGFSNGDNLYLCVLGGDSSGYFQAPNRATFHKWVYSTNYRIDPIDFSSIANIPKWRQVKVHPNNENLVYAFNTMGEVYKSEDKGSTWKLQCMIREHRWELHMKVSPADDGTAYITYNNGPGWGAVQNLYRVDSKGGLACTDLLSEFRGETGSTFLHSGITVAPNGDLWMVEDQYNSMVIRKSSDYGRTWLFVSQMQNSGLSGQLYFNPQDPNMVLLNSRTVNSGTGGAGGRGLFRSLDGGKTWTLVSSLSAFFDPQQIFFDPVISGRVYANNQYLSTDNGSSWSVDAGLNDANRWWLDSSGKGYRLSESGSDTVLLRANGMSDPITFSPLYTFSGLQSDNQRWDVSATGDTIAVVVGDRLHISTDSGVSFNEIVWPGKHLHLTGLSSSDGQKLYGAARSWVIVGSNDSGNTWDFKHSQFSERCDKDARVYAHHLDPDAAWVFSKHCEVKAVTTLDGFNTFKTYSTNETYRFSNGQHFTSANFLDSYMWHKHDGVYKFYRTSDGFSTATQGYPLSGYAPSRGFMAFSHISNPDRYFYKDGEGDLHEARLDDNKAEAAEILNRLTFSDNVSGIAMKTDKDRISLSHLFIAYGGLINETKDDGKTFSLVGSSSSNGISSCNDRILYSYPNNNNLMVAACNNEHKISWTTDGANSWTEIDLETSFDMSCGLTGVTMNASQIFFACNGERGMSFYYTPAVLINAAADNIIPGSEQTGDPLVKVDYPSYYSGIEYSLISAGAVCNATTPGFSTTVPVDTDLVSDGDYKVCVKLTDASGTTYKETTDFTFKGTAPSFTSIDLVADSVDGVQLIDYKEASSTIVGNLVGSNYDKVSYALVDSATTCGNNITYQPTAPTTNSQFFGDAGSYKVCVALSDGVNTPAYGSSSTFTFSKGQVIAKLSNTPKKVSSQTVLNITVGGTNVDAYTYKVGAAPLDCSVSTGYSAETPIATPITDDISAIPNGNFQICVRGVDNTNFEDQLLTSATSYTWQKDSFDFGHMSFGENTYAQNWFDVEVAKWASEPHIYARDLDGRIYLSTDRGASFDLQCKIAHDANSRMLISPVKEVGAIVAANGNAYRVTDLDGEDCNVISNGFTSVVSTFQRAPVAFTQDGGIYMMDEISATVTELKKSMDFGKSWSTIHTFTDVGTNLTINVDPFENENLFVVYEGTALAPFVNEWIYSRNGGETWDGTSRGPGVVEIQDPQIDFKFDPVIKGRLYANNGFISTNNLYNFDDMTGSFPSDFGRWDIDSTGQGVRLVQDGADIDVELSSTLMPAGFTPTYTISGITAGVTDRSVSISGDGQTIAVTLNNQMFISLDGGAFTEVFTPMPYAKLTSITSEDNNTVYAADRSWNFFRSTDSALNWDWRFVHSSGCDAKVRVRTPKSNSNYVIGYADRDSTTCGAIMTSTDGMTTNNLTSNVLWTTSPLSIAFDSSDPNNVAYIANGTVKTSTDFMATNGNTTVTNMSNSGHSYDAMFSAADPNYIYNVAGGNLIEIDLAGGTKTDITSALGFASAAGIEDLGTGSVLAISSTGQLDQSLDDGVSFGGYATDPGLASCNQRILKTLLSDAGNTLATACYNGTTIAYTADAGATWSEIDLSNYSLTNACTISDMAIIEEGGGVKKAAVACENDEAIEVILP